MIETNKWEQLPTGELPDYRRVWIVGAAGAGNLGDDLIAFAAKAWASRRFSTAQISNVGFLRHPYALSAVNLSHEEFFARILKSEINDQDVIIFGGGGIFWSDESSAQWLRIALHARRLGSRLEAHGISLLPNATNHLQNLFLECMDDISVRDCESYASCREREGCNEPRLAPDFVEAYFAEGLLAAGLELEEAPVIVRDQPGIGFAFTETYLPSDPKFEFISEMVAEISEYSRVSVIEQVNHRMSHLEQDLVTSTYLSCRVPRLQRRVETGEPELKEWINSILRQDLVITKRLHTAIVANALSVPCAILGANAEEDAVPLKTLLFAHKHDLPTVSLNAAPPNVARELFALIPMLSREKPVIRLK